MHGWENFLLGELGASAALSGLIFVGISINLSQIMESAYLPNRALEALVALVTVLFISSLLLIPDQSFLAIGLEVLGIGLIDWCVMLLLQLQSWRKMQVQHRSAFVRVVVLCQLAALSFVIAGIELLFVGSSGLYWLVGATLLSFLVAFMDAWVLVIEINR